jgi:hypothetical protein
MECSRPHSAAPFQSGEAGGGLLPLLFFASPFAPPRLVCVYMCVCVCVCVCCVCACRGHESFCTIAIVGVKQQQLDDNGQRPIPAGAGKRGVAPDLVVPSQCQPACSCCCSCSSSIVRSSIIKVLAIMKYLSRLLFVVEAPSFAPIGIVAAPEP